MFGLVCVRAGYAGGEARLQEAFSSATLYQSHDLTSRDSAR